MMSTNRSHGEDLRASDIGTIPGQRQLQLLWWAKILTFEKGCKNRVINVLTLLTQAEDSHLKAYG